MASDEMMLVFTILAISSFLNAAHGGPIVPCHFIFGDSLTDNGNNNVLNTTAKADFPPYRVDLPGIRSLGRLTNGRTMVNFIAQSVGFTDFILPHTTASWSDLLRGMNYASASSGIRDDTGSNLGDHISPNKQLKNHRNVINSSLGDLNETVRLLNSCLYSVGVGNNDYVNDYFAASNRSGEDTPEQFASLLIDECTFQLHLKTTLHGYGVTKIVLFRAGPVGCMPFAIAKSSKNMCADQMNSAVQIFNGKLKQLVDELNG